MQKIYTYIHAIHTRIFAVNVQKNRLGSNGNASVDYLYYEK